MTVEKGVYISMSYMLLFVGFAGAHVINIVLGGGDLTTPAAGIGMSQLTLGILGLVVGLAMNYGQMPKTKAERQKLELEDAVKGTSYGIGLFVGMTLLNTTIRGFEKYQASLREQELMSLLGAAPFEEAFFRLMVATILFRALLEIVPTLRYVLSAGLGTVVALMTGRRSGARSRVIRTDDPLNRGVAMILTALGVAILFVFLHGSVANIADPEVFRFYFINSFFYTMLYLVTGSLLACTTAHLLHNGAVFLMM